MFSKDIRMEFGLDKCATIHIKHGKIENSECVKNIPLLSPNESYKYLGIAQNDTILHNQMKNKTKKEYFQRINAILKTEINAKNTTDAIKTYAMPILRYGFGVIRWTKNELRAIDTKTRKTLTKHGFHHPKSNTHRLYLSRKYGGRGLIGATDCHQQECSALANYLNTAREKDPLVKIVKQTECRKINGIRKKGKYKRNK